MKVLTIFGTRPEIIRLSIVMKVLDRHCEHITVHTGQNYHESLSDIFLRDLGVRTPDINLGIRADRFAAQAAQIIEKTDEVVGEQQPDKILILGDTNSGLATIPAARRGIPIFHMEAGNRCYDDRVPEEINRRIIDHSSTILLPYTERSKENLIAEGIDRERIFVTGNPIAEVLDTYEKEIDSSPALGQNSIGKGEYFLVTLHRAENVDIKERLTSVFEAFAQLTKTYDIPILVSVHPRTRQKLELFNITPETKRIRLLEPLGFFDFVKLEKNARAVLTDSGTVQEECAIFKVPNVTLRDVTERPETLECGSNIISGVEPRSILRSVDIALNGGVNWDPPTEYTAPNVSNAVAKIVLGYTNLRRHTS
ncbi:MAG: UDP-N-acetylglucosamine 2-epimerase (non-hydrolyzing) [Acidobacteriota bacterium]